MITAKPTYEFQDRLYHFGSILPLFYLLKGCSQIKEGVCGNCETPEAQIRMRMILGEGMSAIKEGLIVRACTFAAHYA